MHAYIYTEREEKNVNAGSGVIKGVPPKVIIGDI